MKASVLATCSLLVAGLIGPVYATQITENEILQRQQWEADARDARSLGAFGDCAADDPQIAIRACSIQLRPARNRSPFAQGAEAAGMSSVLDSGNANIRDEFSNAVRYVLRANAYMSRGDTGRALSDYDSAVRSARRAGAVVRDEVYWVHERRAEAYFFEGEYEEALESYEAAIEINPGSLNLLHYRSLELAASYEREFRDEAQSLIYAQTLNALAPGMPDYVAALAVSYAANGEFERAAEEQQRAIALVFDGDERKIAAYQRRLNLFNDGRYVRIAPRIRLLDIQSIRVLDTDASGVVEPEAVE